MILVPVGLTQASAGISFEERSYHFEVPAGQYHEKTTITARLIQPVNHELRGLPLILLFAGFETASRALKLIDPQIPAVIASFDYPYQPPQEFKWTDILGKYRPQTRRAVHLTVAGIVELNRHLKRRIDIDPQKNVIVGASFGAPFVLLAVDQDPSFKGVVMVHGFGNVPLTLSHRLGQILSEKWRSWQFAVKPLAWLSAQLLWWNFSLNDPEEAARRIKSNTKVFMISAKDDHFIPSEVTGDLEKAFGDSGAELEKFHTEGEHLQPHNRFLIPVIMKNVTDWMMRSGLS